MWIGRVSCSISIPPLVVIKYPEAFNFIQQNKVKASGGCLRFSKVVFRACQLENIRWAQIRQGAFDFVVGGLHTCSSLVM